MSKILFLHEKIKFISSSRRVTFFLLYRQKDIDKIIERNDRNNNNNLNIFMQDCCFSFKKKTAINAGPVKN